MWVITSGQTAATKWRTRRSKDLSLTRRSGANSTLSCSLIHRQSVQHSREEKRCPRVWMETRADERLRIIKSFMQMSSRHLEWMDLLPQLCCLLPDVSTWKLADKKNFGEKSSSRGCRTTCADAPPAKQRSNNCHPLSFWFFFFEHPKAKPLYSEIASINGHLSSRRKTMASEMEWPKAYLRARRDE